MKRIVRLMLSIMCGLAAAACGGSDDFVIDCEIEGLGNKGVEAVYLDRGVNRLPYHPVDGKVRMHIPVTKPVVVEVFTIDGERLFACLGRKGDAVKVKMKAGVPASLHIEGQDESGDYAAFMAANDSILAHGTDAEVNALVAKAVRANPKSMASTMLLVTEFRTAGHELMADSLLNTLQPEVRPVSLAGSYASLLGEQLAASVKDDMPSLTIRACSDTTVRYTPSLQSYGLILFTDTRMPDSLRTRLKDLRRDFSKRRLAVVELSLARDSVVWRASMGGDTAAWQHAWVPGGTGSPTLKDIRVPRTPYYIVADSASKIIYRGGSLYAADTLLRSLVKVKRVEAEADTVTAADTVPAPVETPVKFRKAPGVR